MKFIKVVGIFSLTALLSSPLWAYCSKGYSSSCAWGLRGFAYYLIALAVGYFVLHIAEKEDKKYLRILGRVVAGIVLIVSLFGLICKGGSSTCKKRGLKSGSYHCAYSAAVASDSGKVKEKEAQ